MQIKQSIHAAVSGHDWVRKLGGGGGILGDGGLGGKQGVLSGLEGQSKRLGVIAFLYTLCSCECE